MDAANISSYPATIPLLGCQLVGVDGRGKRSENAPRFETFLLSGVQYARTFADL